MPVYGLALLYETQALSHLTLRGSRKVSTTWQTLIFGFKKSDFCERILKFLKMIQMNLLTIQKQTHRLGKQTYGYQRGNVVGRNKLGFWD